MFRILIVDDEPSVVDAIAQTTPWEKLDVEEVFCAYSAKEALAIIEQQFIDIVLTDIRMPGMDGIELIQTIRSFSSRIQCIVLTGHAEFEYAQEALRLHAADYLLKPVRDEVLEQSIRQLTAAMREQWTQIASQQTTIQYVQKHLPTLRSDLLRNTLEGRLLPEELAEKFALLTLPFHDQDIVYPIIIRLERKLKVVMDRSLLEYAVMNIAEEVAGPMFELWTCIDIHNYLVIIAKPRPEMSVERRNETVSRVLSQIQHLVLHYLKENISLVYGQCEKFPHDLTTVYEEALHTLRKKIGSDGGMLLRAGQPHPAAIQHIASLLHAPPSISHLFSAGLWDDAREKLSEVFAACEEAFMEANLHADALAEIYHSIISACYSYAHKNGQSISDALACEDTPEFYSSGELTQSVTLLKEWSLDICRRLSQSNQVEMQDVRESVIKAIQEYIHVHLSEDVSLQTLADHVDLHPVYLSKVYKLVTGESLKDYVFQARMDRAKHLLEQTDHKIYEISSEIGYLNTAYFIKVFKRQYGFTPQEYRERRNEQVMR